MLTLYGPARSRASRVLWMLAECDVPFEHEDLGSYPTMEEKAAALREVYPLGKVPVLRDEDLLLPESMAITLYLAQKYDVLWPKDLKDQARMLQWSFFAVTELDPPLIQLMLERSFRKEADRDPVNEQKNAERVARPLAWLDSSLAGRDWLVGDTFTVADLNVASIFAMEKPAKLDLGEYPNVRAWLERCRARPSHAKSQGG